MTPLINDLKTFIKDIYTITSNKVFEQDRYFYFRVFRDKYNLYKHWTEPANYPSKIPIDVIIPVIEKDLAVLPHVIRGIRQHIQHPIKEIYIVAPLSAVIEDCAKQYQCLFVDETNICDITKSNIDFVINGCDRSNWIYQQLLKFNFHTIGQCENYLVVDADTVFIKDTRFDKRGKFYFDFSDEFHAPYYQSYELLTGLKHQMPVSFITHYMLFNKTKLRSLKFLIKRTRYLFTEDAIIQLKKEVDEYSYFSEYETYANYCLQNYPNEHRIRYWFNKSVPQQNINNIKNLVGQTSAFQTLSFHSHHNS